MGLFERIFGALAKGDPGVRHPGGGFDTPAAAIAEIVRRHRAAEDDGWVDLDASAGGDGRRAAERALRPWRGLRALGTAGVLTHS